jgi:hypothetical protein
MESEFERLLDQASSFFGSIDPKLYSKVTSQSSARPSLMNLNSQSLKSAVHRLNSFGLHPAFIINSGSSDEASDEEKSFPSIRQVTESVLDSQYTSITV